MKTKEQKLARIDELIKCLDISREDVIKHWQLMPMTNVSAIEVLSKTNNPNIKPGMFWYEDDTFSCYRITDKKIKAIVELVENDVIYGDLTASELFDIPERRMSWFSAKQFFDKFSYPCGENEKIVGYNIDQLQSVYKNYNAVKEAFSKLNKMYRKSVYWSSTENGTMVAGVLDFSSGYRGYYHECHYLYVRPVLALKIE